MLEPLKDTISLGYYAFSRLFNPDCNKEVVLLYHSVGHINNHYKLNLDQSLFEEYIKFIASQKKKNIKITFDDGFDNFFDIVLPIVSKYNIATILFISVGFIDGAISSNIFFNNRFDINPLTWAQIKKIADAGIEIGSHAITHTNLLKADEKAIRVEIVDSKKRIEDKIGKKIRYFAYPYGGRNSFNNHIKEIVKNNGYEKAYTNIMGFNTKDSDLYELRRIRIYGNDNMFRFKLKIEGAYNWVDSFNNFLS